jgi:hypothetical protein
VRQFYVELEWLIENELVLNRPIEKIFPDLSALGDDYKKNVMFGVSQLCEMLFGVFTSKLVKEALKSEKARSEMLIELRKSGNKGTNADSLDKAISDLNQLFRKKILPRFESDGYIAPVKFKENDFENSLIESVVTSNDFLIRAESIRLNSEEGFSSVPILTGKQSFNDKADERKAQVFQIVFDSVPFPSVDVPWEQIIEFKSDPDARTKRLALRNWITEISVNKLPLSEIEEKLEFLLDQYEQQMKIHKINYKKGILETIVTTTAEMIENLAKLRLGKLAQMPFSLKANKIKLMQEELKAPGCEVAYISKVKHQNFG